MFGLVLGPETVNLGIGSEVEAAAPAAAVNDGGVGAKLRFTLAVAAGGEFCPTLDTNVVNTANLNVSMAAGLVLITSQTAVAVPAVTGISATLMVLVVPPTPGALSVATMAGKKVDVLTS